MGNALIDFTPRPRSLGTLLPVVLALAFSSAAFGQTAIKNGAWNDPSTWSGSEIPTIDDSLDIVVIPDGIQVWIPGEYPVDALYGVIDVQGELTLQSTMVIDGGTLTNAGSFYINLSASLEITGIDSSFLNQGYFLNQGIFKPSIWSDFYNEGTFENFGTFNVRPRAHFINEATGYFTNHGSFFMGNYSEASNHGTMINFAEITFDWLVGYPHPSPVLSNSGGSLTNAGGGTMDIEGRIFNGTFDDRVSEIRNHGEITLIQGYFSNRGTGTSVIHNFGSIINTYSRIESSAPTHGDDNHILNWPDAFLSGQIWVPAGTLVNLDGGIVEIPVGETLIVEGSGLVDNDSEIRNAGSIDNTGTVANRCNGIIDSASYGGTYEGNPIQDWCDSTPPVIVPAVSGTTGNNGWYVTDIHLDWSVTDPDTPIQSSSGCGSVSILTDTAGVSYQCEATSPGGTASKSVFLKRDATRPLVSADRVPATNSHGWNNTDVTVSFYGTDALSGIASCTAPAVLSVEAAGQSASGFCTDNAGNASPTVSVDGINIDKSSPVIAFAGNQGSYSPSDLVDITCSAEDSLSGVASAHCPSAQGRGYEFDLEATNVLNAHAEDFAGNASQASAAFDVTVTVDSIGELIAEFITDVPKANKALRALEAIEAETRPEKRSKKLQHLLDDLQKLVDKGLLDAANKGVLTVLLELFYG